MHRDTEHEARLQYGRTLAVMMSRFALAVAVLAFVAPLSANSAATIDDATLNVTIPVFQPGIPSDPSAFRDLQIFPRIRQVEAKLMPFVLRETLVETGRWGAVRVATSPEAAAELQLLGTIVRSDGDWLEIRIRAVDATGRAWLDETFSARAEEDAEAREGDQHTPEFAALYAGIEARLDAVRATMSSAELRNIKNTSLMRYASALAPSAFSGLVEQGDDGTWRALRLPARNDPMFVRIETIRDTEFLITDTVDAKFRELNADLARTYRVWRDYRRKLVDYHAENVRFAEAKPENAERGSWDSIKHQYDAYKYDRITAQEQDRLAVAFNNEVAETIDAMEDRVAELDGWVAQGHQEWQSLLEDLFEVETYLLESGEAAASDRMEP